MALTPDQIRQLSIETSMVAVQNIAVSGHSGLVTLRMERGVVRRVWCGTPAGLLVWIDGNTICHVIQNVGKPLSHG